MVLALLCADKATGLNGRLLPTNGVGQGIEHVRYLEGLIGSRALVQDIDWPVSDEGKVFDVVAADVAAVGTFDRKLGRRADQYVALVTFRRAVL